MIRLRSLGAAALLALAAACSGDTAGPVPVASVQVEASAQQVLPGGTLQLAATPRDAAGAALAGRPVEWSSLTPSLASVDASGRVTGIAPGAATIVARAGEASGQVALTVLPHPVASVTLSADSATLAPGAARAFTATTRDAAGGALPGRALAWTSSNEAVALVNADGVVAARAEGTAQIRAASEGVQSAPLVVTVREPIATLAIQPATATLRTGDKLRYTVTAHDASGREMAGRTVTVATSTPDVVGLLADSLHALAPGAATITATAEGRTATAQITVLARVASVVLAPDTATLEPGTTRRISATPRDADGNALTGRTVSLTSSHPAVATVAADGTVSARTEGTAVIRAVSEGQSGTATITVRGVVASVSLEVAPSDMIVGEKRGYRVVARDARGTALSRAAAVSSSAPDVVDVRADTLLARVAGTATVTAEVEGYTASVAVNVLPVPTEVGGIISTDRRWTRAGSPYRLSAAVQVAYGATLTIEPGVTVLGQGRPMEVYGTLHAVGTEAQPVRFANVNLRPQGASGRPFVLRMEHTVLDRGIFYMPTGNGGYGSMVLRNSLLRDLASYLYVWYPVADVVIEGNRFVRTGGISAGARAPVRVIVRNNVFVDWTGGFAVENWASYGGEVMVVEGNSFLSTDRVAVRLPRDYPDARLSAPGNYWGTTDEAVIRSMIFDVNDDLGSGGTIEYRPFLTAPDPATPAP